MKIALISPRADSLSRNPAFREFWKTSEYTKTYRSNWTGIAPGLATVAGLTPVEHDVEIIDENNREIDFDANYDLVGVSAMTQQAPRAYEIADRFRERSVTTVLGGIHGTSLPEEALNYFDSVVIGEAEQNWELLIEDFSNNRLKPTYRSDFRADLTQSPLPRYDLLKDYNYRVIWIQCSRGCPRDCEFCSATTVYGKKARMKSVEQVIEEIKFIKRVHGKTVIGFGDDNLLANQKYSKPLLEALIPLKIRYYAQSDISIARNDELLHLMRRSGCVCIFIGFESVTEEGLKNIDNHGWKQRQLKHYSEYIAKIQSFGIGVMGAFMVGLDSDDTTVFDAVSRFIINNKLYEAQITISTPLPKTRLRDRLEKDDRLLPLGWDNYTLCDVTFKHPKLSKEELENGLLSICKTIHTKEIYEKKMQHFSSIYKDLRKKGLKLWGAA